MRLTANEVQKLCRSLKPVIGEQADGLWLAYLAEDDKGKRELEEFLPLLAFKVLGKSLSEENILLPPPTQESAAGEFPIGRIIYNKVALHELSLRKEDFIRQVGIFSITGAGKTNLGLLLAMQLLKKKIPFLVVDWKRQWRSILSVNPGQNPELKDVQIFTIGRNTSFFQWNPFRGPPGIHYKTWLSVIAEVLEKSHLGGQGVADVFLRIYERVFSELGFDEGKENMCPNFFDGLRELQKEKGYARELLWQQSCGRILRSFTYGPQASCFNARHPIRLEELLEKPVIIELDQELPKWLRIFLAELILRYIHLYRLSQGETMMLRHVLFLEEVHNLFPRGWGFQKDSSSSSLENIYREIRAFGQGVVSITQHTSLLPIYILGNCQVQINLALQHGDDIDASKKSIFLKAGEEVYLDKLKIGEGLVKIKSRVEPCLVKFPLVPIQIGQINDEAVKRHMEGYFADLQANSSKNGVITPDSTQDKISENEKKLLEDVLKFPLCGVATRYHQLRMNPRQGNACKDSLVEKCFLETVEIMTGKGRVLILKLTQKACDYLRTTGHKVPEDVNSIEHRFWKGRVAHYYEEKGFTVEIEKFSDGHRPDITVKGEGKAIAVEIETGKSKPIQNILDRLKAGFDYVISVPTSDGVEKTIREKLKALNLDNDKRIRVVSVKAF